MDRKLVFLLSLLVATNGFTQSKVAGSKDLKSFKVQKSDSPNVSLEDGKPNSVSNSQQRVCTANDQTSLPLKYLWLLSDKSSDFEVKHDAETGRGKVVGPNMTQGYMRCSDMIEWDLSQSEDQKKYYFEAKIKQCASKENCEYSFVNDAGESEKKQFKPSLDGFEQCLIATGMINDKGELNKEKAVADQPFIHEFENALTSGDVFYKSRGNLVNTLGVLHSKDPLDAKKVNKPEFMGDCSYSEPLSEDKVHFYSVKEIKNLQLNEQFQAKCKSKDYKGIDALLKDLEGVSETFKIAEKARDQIILEKVQEIAAHLKKSNNLENLDLSVIADFKEKIITPKVKEIESLYSDIQDEKDSAKKSELEKQLKAKVAELKKLRMKPYLTDRHLKKLWEKGPLSDDGFYEGVLALHEARTTIKTYEGVGKVQDGVTYSLINMPKVINNKKLSFAKFMREKRLHYEVKTGERDGVVAEFQRKQQANLEQIQENNQIAMENIQSEQEIMMRRCRMKIGQWQQRCYQEHQEAIQEIQEDLQFQNAKLSNKASYHQRMAASFQADETYANKMRAKEEKDDDENYDTDSYVDDLMKDDVGNSKVYKFDYKNKYSDVDDNQQQNQWQQWQQYQQYQQPQYPYNGQSGPGWMSGYNGAGNGAGAGFQFGLGRQPAYYGAPQQQYYGAPNQYYGSGAGGFQQPWAGGQQGGGSGAYYFNM